MNRRVAIPSIIVAALVVAAVWSWREPAPGVLPAKAAVEEGAAPTVPVSPVPSTADTSPVPAADKGAVPPFEQLRGMSYSELLPLARAGDATAMYTLGSLLRPCDNYQSPAARRFLELRREDLARLEREATPDEASRARIDAVRDEIDGGERENAECMKVPENERHWIAWIEAAARAGSHGARTYYVQDALDDYGLGVPDLVVNIDEVIRRRDLARRFAQEEIDACTPGAFQMRATAMNGTLGIIDPARRLEIAQAALLAADSDVDRDIARTLAVEAAALLDEAARAQARHAGDDAWRRCAGRH